MDWVSFGIACYGAGLSTTAVLWQIKTRRDRIRGRIKVAVRDNMMTYSSIEGETGPFIVYTAVNDGEKPVRVEALYVKVKGANTAFWIKCDHLPKMLTEGEEFNQMSDRTEVLKSLGGLGIKPPWKCYAVFRSNAGREYKKRFIVRP